MRKVLLATTALVALNVSAASADISISGSYNIEFRNTANDTSTYQDGNVVIKATGSTDTGLTYTVANDVSIWGTNPAIEQSYLEIGGDFGSVRMGHGDTVFDRMDGVLGMNQDVEGEIAISTVDTAGTLDADGVNVGYMAPAIGGLKLGVHLDVDNDKVGVAGTYSLGGVSAYYGVLDDETSYGVGTSLAGFGINLGGYRNSGSTKQSANDIAVSYSMDNMKVVALRQTGDDGTDKKTTETIGMKYTVGGLWLGLEAGDANGASYSWLGIGASF
jgi:predicted porin